jgi:hypothetical protein
MNQMGAMWFTVLGWTIVMGVALAVFFAFWDKGALGFISVLIFAELVVLIVLACLGLWLSKG